MNYEEFTANVEKWQEEKGIYEHSTPLAQALKAVSEVGELADAVIKGDDDAIKDAIGDVMVCLVGVQKMLGITMAEPEMDGVFHGEPYDQSLASIIAYFVSDIASDIANGSSNTIIESGVFEVVIQMKTLCVKKGFTFMECCDKAWQAIRFRTGRMVAGGAFVKDEE